MSDDKHVEKSFSDIEDDKKDSISLNRGDTITYGKYSLRVNRLHTVNSDKTAYLNHDELQALKLLDNEYKEITIHGSIVIHANEILLRHRHHRYGEEWTAESAMKEACLLRQYLNDRTRLLERQTRDLYQGKYIRVGLRSIASAVERVIEEEIQECKFFHPSLFETKE